MYTFNEKHKREIIKQLSEKLEKDIFQNGKRLPQKEFCTKVHFFFCKKICGKGCFSKFFCKEKRIFPRSSRHSDVSHGIEPGALAHCNVSLSLHQYARSPRVWSDRACGAVRLKNASVCQRRDAPLHPLMKCASPTQCCFGATRRWWCDLSHVGPWRTLAPSSIATVFSHNILAMILSQKEQS